MFKLPPNRVRIFSFLLVTGLPGALLIWFLVRMVAPLPATSAVVSVTFLASWLSLAALPVYYSKKLFSAWNRLVSVSSRYAVRWITFVCFRSVTCMASSSEQPSDAERREHGQWRKHRCVSESQRSSIDGQFREISRYRDDAFYRPFIWMIGKITTSEPTSSRNNGHTYTLY